LEEISSAFGGNTRLSRIPFFLYHHQQALNCVVGVFLFGFAYHQQFTVFWFKEDLTMFRYGVRRCGGLARTAASSAMLLSARTVFPAARSAASTLPRPVASLKSFASLNRLYSSEAAAAETVAPETAATGEITSFQDLEAIGVHRNLLDAITKDMRYDSMTPVQAKTINPALKGTDM
jgi:hypothetical protein